MTTTLQIPHSVLRRLGLTDGPRLAANIVASVASIVDSRAARLAAATDQEDDALYVSVYPESNAAGHRQVAPVEATSRADDDLYASFYPKST